MAIDGFGWRSLTDVGFIGLLWTVGCRYRSIGSFGLPWVDGCSGCLMVAKGFNCCRGFWWLSVAVGVGVDGCRGF